MIDTSPLYQNEKLIGEVVKECINTGEVKREDLFLKTKNWID